MFLILIVILVATLICLMIRDAIELRKNKKNIGCGWKVTPYVNSKISSFENRMDLEKLRLIELIKNKLQFDYDIKVIENDKNSFYIKKGKELRFLEIFAENDFKEFEKKEFRYKFGRGEECDIYNLIRKTVNNHIWDYKEENLGGYGHRIYLSFKSGIIVLDISKTNSMIFTENGEGGLN
ncbi:hypothetical protein [Clostridium sp. B9]|uniref:hypothetical protein n=1 Tax=Clostridium sp. B9 TaxID=3423224 RepID=UPI003D2F124E